MSYDTLLDIIHILHNHEPHVWLTPRLTRLRVDEVNLIFTQLRQQSVVENHGGSKSG